MFLLTSECRQGQGMITPLTSCDGSVLVQREYRQEWQSSGRTSGNERTSKSSRSRSHSHSPGPFVHLQLPQLYAEPSMIYWMREHLDIENCIIVSPDAGGAKR
jgi:hypothetical protein